MDNLKRIIIVMIAFVIQFALTGCVGGNVHEPRENGYNDEAANDNITTYYAGVADAEDVEDVEDVDGSDGQSHQATSATPVRPAFLEFSSIAEFLEGYISFREGTASEQFTSLAEQVDLAGLDRIYIPTGLPEKYQLYRILISAQSVILRFLPEEYLTSEEDMDIERFQRQVQLMFFRGWTAEAAHEGFLSQNRITEADLIAERYYYNARRNDIQWVSDDTRVILTMPRSPITAARGVLDVAELVQYAAVETVNLFNNTDIDEFLAELRAED